MINYQLIMRRYKINQTNNLKNKRVNEIDEGVARANTNIQKFEMALEDRCNFHG